MTTGETVTVLRDCPAAHVPIGTPVTIPAGSQVVITQELGGSFTVNVGGNLVRINGKNADALGLPVAGEGVEKAQGHEPVTTEQVWKVLATCYDPEIPVNIVDMGLIYDVALADAENGKRVDIAMTLTAPGCGMGPYIVEDIRSKLLDIPGVSGVEVELVYDPPWDRDMMSEAARLELGLF